ncbi:MAG: glycosyltransferase [Solirubrobacteraceae bacterium]
MGRQPPIEPRAQIRALLLSADVGESHAQMARALAAELEGMEQVAEVTVLNDLGVLGRALGERLSHGFAVHLGQARWTYDAAYALFSRVRAARTLGERALYALGGNSLQATIERHRPDVVVSTYPVLNPVLARLRTSGRCRCPVAAVVGPVGGHAFWVQPGLDLHMALQPEALPSIRRLAGGSPVRAVRPLVRQEFFEPRSRAQARSELGLRAGVPVALVCGGGWGAGDLVGAVTECLRVPGLDVVAVAGRNPQALAELSAHFEREPRVTALGFTERMSDLMYSADVLITATAGLSCVEARLCGCPIVVHGFPVGHVRDNAAALAEHGLALVATDRESLPAIVQTALRNGRAPAANDLSSGALPTAAELVSALANGRASAGGRADGAGLHKRTPAGVTQATWPLQP